VIIGFIPFDISKMKLFFRLWNCVSVIFPMSKEFLSMYQMQHWSSECHWT